MSFDYLGAMADAVAPELLPRHWLDKISRETIARM